MFILIIDKDTKDCKNCPYLIGGRCFPFAIQINNYERCPKCVKHTGEVIVGDMLNRIMEEDD